MDNIENEFEILISTKPLTDREKSNPDKVLDYEEMLREAEFYRRNLYRKLFSNYPDFKSIAQNEKIIIKYYNPDKSKIDYSLITNRKKKDQIRRLVESVHPISF